MAMPLRQSIKVATYLAEQKLRRRDKFPLIVELEPLFACNLKCEGCGKIQHPAGVLKQRMPVAQAVGAVLESGAPMVSIAGGEPLMHPQIDEIVRQLVAKRKYVFLCTNALLHAQEDGQVQALALLRLRGAHRRAARAARRVGGEGGRVRRGRGGDQGGQAARLPGHHQLDLLQHRHPADHHRGAELPQRRPPGRRDDDLARLRLREGPRPGALPRRRADPRAVQEGLRGRQPAGAGGSTTPRSSWTSWRARSTSRAPRGRSRTTRCSAGSAPAT